MQNNQANNLLKLLCSLLVAEEGRDKELLIERLRGESTDRILLLIDWHRIQVAFWEAIKGHQKQLSETLVEALRQRARKFRINALEQQGILLAVLDKTLTDNGVPYIVFKGIVLSQLLHNDASYRHAKDIDIWVDDDQVEKVCRLLVGAGFICSQPECINSKKSLSVYQTHQKDLVFTLSDKPRIEVELHWRLDKNRHAYQLSFSDAIRRSSVLVLGNRAFNTFDTKTYLRYLCIHGSLAMWGRLKWLLDWYAIVEKANHDGIDWSSLLIDLQSSGHVQNAMIASHLSKLLFQQPTPAMLEHQRLSINSRLIVSLVTVYMSRGTYPPLILRWCLRLFLITGWRYKFSQFALVFGQLRWRLFKS